MQERDEQLRALREENLQVQRKFQKELENEMASATELRDAVNKLSLRKEELKQQLLDKEAEMDELKDAYRYPHGVVFYLHITCMSCETTGGFYNKCTQLDCILISACKLHDIVLEHHLVWLKLMTPTRHLLECSARLSFWEKTLLKSFISKCNCV